MSLQSKILRTTSAMLPLLGLFFTRGWGDTFQPFFPLLPILRSELFIVFVVLSLALFGIERMLTKRETSSKSMMRNINEVEWKRLGLLLLATFIAVLFIPSSPLLMGFLPLTDFAIGISLLTLSILWFERKYRVAFYFTILAGGVIIFLALFLASIRVPSPISLPGPAPKQDLPALIPAGGFFIVAYILHKRVREKS